jgi:hypothetical protein
MKKQRYLIDSKNILQNRIFILFFLFSVSLVHGQIPIKLDKTYYLLGTLGDYMGRQLCILNTNSWDYLMSLHQRDSAKIKRIEEITMLKFTKGENKEKHLNNHSFYALFSSDVARKINSFYVFKKQGCCQDENRYTGTIYRGNLKCSKILKASKEQQYSFIAGLFLTHGEKIDDVYKIILSNSPCRYECTIRILKLLNSEIVSSIKTEGTVDRTFLIRKIGEEWIIEIISFVGS